MVVDDGPGDAGRPRNGLDRDAAVALLEDHAQRRVDQLLAALARAASAGRSAAADWCSLLPVAVAFAAGGYHGRDAIATVV